MNRLTASGWAACTLMWTLATASGAWAQDTGDIARRLVGEGIEAARSQDWITAQDRFARAYEIQPLPLTLYNLAAAQEKTGDLVGADRSYRIFLRETAPGETDDFRRIAIERRKALKGRICYVVLSAENLDPDDVVLVDGKEIAHAVLGESLPSNPGALNVRVERHGQVVANQRVALSEGDTQRVELTLPAYEPPMAAPAATSERGAAQNGAPAPATGSSPAAADNPGAAAPAAAAEDEEGSVFASPILWGTVGAVALGTVVLVAAGAAGGVIAYFTPSDKPVTTSTIDPVAIEGR